MFTVTSNIQITLLPYAPTVTLPEVSPSINFGAWFSSVSMHASESPGRFVKPGIAGPAPF